MSMVPSVTAPSPFQHAADPLPEPRHEVDVVEGERALDRHVELALPGGAGPGIGVAHEQPNRVVAVGKAAGAELKPHLGAGRRVVALLENSPNGVVELGTDACSEVICAGATLVGPPVITAPAAVQAGPPSIAATVVPPAAQR